MAVSTIEDQLPMFKAFCTLSFSLLILTNQVPTIEKTIPIPAMSMGNKIGESPPNLSAEASISWPNTMVARIVAT